MTKPVALVFDIPALHLLQQVYFPSSWYTTFYPVELPDLAITQRGQVVFCVKNTNTFSAQSPKLVIDTNAIDFSAVPDESRDHLLRRIARVALSQFEHGVQIPQQWNPYHVGSLISVFAYSFASRDYARLVIDFRPRSSNDAYACHLGEKESVYALESFVPNFSAYDAAIAEARNVSIKANAVTTAPSLSAPNVELTEVFPGTEVTKSAKYSEWYGRRLSKRQKEFVDHPVNRAIRLRGAAGTGKTLAMVVKVLNTLYAAQDSNTPTRIAYITHSWNAAETVDRMIRSIDERGLFETEEKSLTLDIAPLIAFADDAMQYKRINVRPLGSDSSDGKIELRALIASALSGFKSEEWPAYRSACSLEFRARIDCDAKSVGGKALAWDLMIEFACVIGALGIFPNSGEDNKYIKLRRLKWMMSLPEEGDRIVVLKIYSRIILMLLNQKKVSVDQITNDYLNKLNTFYWENARKTLGYDYVFVDEMHLFNAQERLIFHHLLRERSATPPVIMALDPKQSPSDTFVDIPVGLGTADDERSIYRRARLGTPTKLELDVVYRYAEPIAQLIKFLDTSFPAEELGEDWDRLIVRAHTKEGRTPAFHVCKDAVEEFRMAFSLAETLVSRGTKRARKVAILCLNEERYLTFATAAKGQHAGKSYTISSRDEIEKLDYAGKRVAISMPEYVAGLQFESVIILDANEGDLPRGGYSGFQLRRFLSELYLGVSRAETSLTIFATQDRGGLLNILTAAASEGLIVPLSA